MPSISPDTLAFFSEIKDNNNKPWFEENKARFEVIKNDFTAFMAALAAELNKIDPILEKDPKKSLFRIYRDVRFSKDKSPYKINMGGLIERAPNYKKCPLYIHIQPGNSFVGGGIWEPEPALLKRIRQEIDFNGEELVKIINKKAFKDLFGGVSGEKLQRVPKGYEADNPNAELLKHKQFTIQKAFTDDLVLSDGLIPAIAEVYKGALDFFNYFDEITSDLQGE